MVDFHVPGKPAYPPVALKAAYYEAAGGVGMPTALPIMLFTDPSGTLAPPEQPVNTWVVASAALR